jgi:CheY-like chemotaxis protein
VQLESALLNLSINARDAMPDGGKLIIELANAHLSEDYANKEEEVLPGQYVMVAVSDMGTGMSPETMSRVFDPFFTTKAPGRGSGLGLSMVFGFIKQSRGHIKVYSEVGEGTTVRLYMPRATPYAATEPALSSEPEIRSHVKILLVEDDDLVRGHILSQLRTLGYTVVEARNGREAIEAVRQISDIDLLFTDIVMPGGMSGKEVAAEVHKLRPAIRVLFTSGYTQNAIVHAGRLDPGVNFISKPFRQVDLERKINQILSDDSGQA